MKKNLTALALLAGLTLGLTACTETFTFEAVPVGVDDDDAESGLDGDPKRFDCFTIEADASNGDDNDVQLGTFCRRDDDTTGTD